MAIISQETFEKFTEEEKEKLFKLYNSDYNDWGFFTTLENLFGTGTLQPKSVIKTWKDIENNSENEDAYCCALENTLSKNYFDDKLRNKLIATFKIYKLIELGYGGIVTEEEWKDDEIIKYGVTWHYNSNNWFYSNVSIRKQFIVFRTDSQRKEFMSHPENIELLKQYYMI